MGAACFGQEGHDASVFEAARKAVVSKGISVAEEIAGLKWRECVAQMEKESVAVIGLVRLADNSGAGEISR